MATSTYGKLGPFSPNLTPSKLMYVERAKIYFRANDVPEDKQAVVFLSELGDKTYSVLRNLTAPELPQSKK